MSVQWNARNVKLVRSNTYVGWKRIERQSKGPCLLYRNGRLLTCALTALSICVCTSVFHVLFNRFLCIDAIFAADQRRLITEEATQQRPTMNTDDLHNKSANKESRE